MLLMCMINKIIIFRTFCCCCCCKSYVDCMEGILVSENYNALKEQLTDKIYKSTSGVASIWTHNPVQKLTWLVQNTRVRSITFVRIDINVAIKLSDIMVFVTSRTEEEEMLVKNEVSLFYMISPPPPPPSPTPLYDLIDGMIVDRALWQNSKRGLKRLKLFFTINKEVCSLINSSLYTYNIM